MFRFGSPSGVSTNRFWGKLSLTLWRRCSTIRIWIEPFCHRSKRAGIAMNVKRDRKKRTKKRSEFNDFWRNISIFLIFFSATFVNGVHVQCDTHILFIKNWKLHNGTNCLNAIWILWALFRIKYDKISNNESWQFMIYLFIIYTLGELFTNYGKIGGIKFVLL